MTCKCGHKKEWHCSRIRRYYPFKPNNNGACIYNGISFKCECDVFRKKVVKKKVCLCGRKDGKHIGKVSDWW